MLPIVQDFGIFAPFAFSPCWIFSALRRTSRVSRHGGLEHSVTFRPVADTLAKHVRLRSLPVPASRHRRAAKLNFCFQPLGAGLLASLSNISLLLRRSRSANVPTFGAPPGEGAAAAAHRGIVGNGVFGGARRWRVLSCWTLRLKKNWALFETNPFDVFIQKTQWLLLHYFADVTECSSYLKKQNNDKYI